MPPQSANTKRGLLARSAGIFAIRIAPAFAAAVVGILFSHRLPRAINGLYGEIWVTLAVMLAIGGAGLQPFMLTHPAEAIDGWIMAMRKRQQFGLLLWMIACMNVFVWFLRETWAQVHVLALYLLFIMQLLTLLYETYLVVQRRFALVASLSFFYSIFFLVAHYLFLKGWFGFGILIVLVAGISTLRAAGLCIGAVRIFSAKRKALMPAVIPKEVRRQWLQLGIYDCSQTLFRWMDKFIVGRIVGQELFAIYFVGTTDVPFMHTLLGAAGSGLLQQLSQEPKTTEARVVLLRFSGAALSRIVFPFFFFFFFFRVEFIEVFFSKAYLDAVPLFAISSLAIPLRAYSFTSMLQHLNRVPIINIGALLDLSIALTLSYPLYLWKGLPGVAFAFTVCSYGQALFYLYHTARQLGCPILRLIPWKSWGVQLIVFGCAAIALHHVLTGLGSIRQTLLLGFVGTSLAIITALLPLLINKNTHE